MRATVPSWVVVFFVLGSGCSAPPAAEDVATASASAGETVTGGGAIRGFVVDMQQMPIANASAKLSAPGPDSQTIQQTNTSSNGAFEFIRLPPGTYRIEATAAGFAPGSVLATVQDDEITGAHVVLSDVAAAVPYMLQFQKVGRLSCSVSLLLAPSASNCPGEDAAFMRSFDVPTGFAFLLAESTWRTDETLAQYFYIENRTTNGGQSLAAIGEEWGEKTIRAAFFPGETRKPLSSNPVVAGAFQSVPEQAFRLNVTTYYAGLYAREANQTLGPACRAVYGRCAGIGFAADLRFETYVTIFVNGLPAAPAEYSALPPP